MLSRLAATVNRWRTASSPGPLEQFVENVVDVQPVEAGQKLGQILMRRALLRVFGGRVDLYAVAGREQHRLDVRKARAQVVQRGLGLRRAERQPFANRHRRVPMAATEHLQLHGAPAAEGR